MKLKIYNHNGNKTTKTIDLDDAVFAVEPNSHAIYMAVKAQQKNMRQGNASTKTRTMVRGGGRKPWRQKGRGAARVGTIRSPLWKGGGIIHGPLSRSYSMKVNKKIKKLAKKSVLSSRVKEEKLKVIEDIFLENPKTSDLKKLLINMGVASEKTLLLVAEHDHNMVVASKNLKLLGVQIAKDASPMELLSYKNVLLTESSVKTLEGILKS
ncbi:50S ribosomal protein L4 [candidate division KSB1 bacterium]|nr:50S ribosomal protein L4 [candidate division KSB1 bacterium]